MKVPEYTESPEDQQRKEAQAFLQSLLNKNLRVTTADERMFWGTFMCTDPVLSSLFPNAVSLPNSSAGEQRDPPAHVRVPPALGTEAR